MIKFYFLLDLMFVDTALFFCVIVGSDFLCVGFFFPFSLFY